MTIYNLDNEQLIEAYRESQRYIASLLESPDWTYASLAAEIGIKESALKQFVRRGADREALPMRRGASFDRIYRFTTNNPKIADLSNIATHNPSDRYLSDSQKRGIYRTLLNILGVHSDSLTGCADKVFSRRHFLCFRNSIDPRLAVVSEMDFKRLSKAEQIWEFNHYYPDSDGFDKKSDGIAMVINKTIYLLGDLQMGEGLDIFVMREPMGKAQYLTGFLVSMADYYTPFCGNIVIADADQVRINGEEIAEGPGRVIAKEHLRDYALVDNSDFGSQLETHLNIEASSSVLKIKTPSLVPGFFS